MSSGTLTNIAKVSAAGAGKTWDLCHDALDVVKHDDKRVLITTYTNRGIETIRKELCLQNDGVLHPRVIIKTWFSFLMSELIKPYQRYVADDSLFNFIKGFDFTEVYGVVNKHKIGTRLRYITPDFEVRVNQASELAVFLEKKTGGKVIRRLEEIYDAIYFDEIQDLTGYDIDIIRLLIDSKIGVICCGDNKQATFSTHNAKKNKSQAGKNIWVFFKELENKGKIQIQKNLFSRRFNNQICVFANKLFPVGEPISTIMDEETGHDGVYIIQETDIDVYCRVYRPQALRYDVKTKVDINVINFGACKGETFPRVIIFPNGPLNDFLLKGKQLKSPERYYVGITRTKYSIAFVMKKLPEKLIGYERVDILCDIERIQALHFLAEQSKSDK